MKPEEEAKKRLARAQELGEMAHKNIVPRPLVEAGATWWPPRQIITKFRGEVQRIFGEDPPKEEARPRPALRVLD